MQKKQPSFVFDFKSLHPWRIGDIITVVGTPKNVLRSVELNYLWIPDWWTRPKYHGITRSRQGRAIIRLRMRRRKLRKV